MTFIRDCMEDEDSSLYGGARNPTVLFLVMLRLRQGFRLGRNSLAEPIKTEHRRDFQALKACGVALKATLVL